MAKIETPCFNILDPLSRLETYTKDYNTALENVYDIIYSDAEWASLVADYDLELLNLPEETFGTRPDWDVIYNYSYSSTEPGMRGSSVDPFGATREPLKQLELDYKILKTAISTFLPYIEEAKKEPTILPEVYDSLSKLQSYLNFDSDQKQNNSTFLEQISSWKREYFELDYIPAGTLQEFDSIYSTELDELTRKMSIVALDATKICPDDIYELVKNGVIKLFDDAIKQSMDIVGMANDPGGGISNYTDEELQNISSNNLLYNRAQKLLKLRALRESLKATIESFAGDNLAYSEQCLLLTFIDELIEISGKEKSYPYYSSAYNNPIKIGGNPFAFTNSLVTDSSQKELFELKQQVVSQLMPYIRLSKVEKNSQGVDQEIPITFDTNISNDLKGAKNTLQRQRGYGVGLQDFTFSYEGTDPFSAKKAITAKLTLFSSTFDDLLKERGGFRYADLALKTGGVAASQLKNLTKIQKENADKLNFRLKAVVGWNVPRETFVGLTPDQKKAIYNSYITIYLTPTIHSFDFDETGAVIFSIEYLAYIEDVFAQSQFNIFSSLIKETEIRNTILQFQKEKSCGENKEEYEKLVKFDEKFVTKLNLRAYSDLVSELAARDKIYYLNLSNNDVAKLLEDPYTDEVKFPEPFSSAGLSIERIKDIRDALQTSMDGEDGAERSIQMLSSIAASQDNNSLAFFYIQDIVTVAMHLIEQELEKAQNLEETEYYKEAAKFFTYGSAKEFKKLLSEKQFKFKNSLQQFQQMRIILGPAEIYSPAKGFKSTFTTLGDIPISLNYFFEFLSKKVISKEIINYPLSKFVKELCNDLITNFLNSESCGRVNTSQRLNINSTSVIAYNRDSNSRGKWSSGNPPLDDLTFQTVINKYIRKDGEPLLLLSGKRDVPITNLSLNRMINYYVFSIGKKTAADDFVGDKGKDAARGIFHYVLGRDKGIIKNISLEKTTTTGLKEVRFEQEGYDGLSQLREVYNVTVDSFLNVQTFPGTYIYVEPRGFSPNTQEDLTRYGIGGYCMITKTTHSIKPGDATTTLNAAWVASKKGAQTDKGATKRKPEASSVQKCVSTPTFRTNDRWDI